MVKGCAREKQSTVKGLTEIQRVHVTIQLSKASAVNSGADSTVHQELSRRG